MSDLVNLIKLGDRIGQNFFNRALRSIFGEEKAHQYEKNVINFLENKFEIHREGLSVLDTPAGFPVKFVVTYFPPILKTTKQMTLDLDSWANKKASREISQKFESEGLKSRVMELSHYPDRCEIILYFKDEASCQAFIDQSREAGTVSRQKQIELGYRVSAKIFSKV